MEEEVGVETGEVEAADMAGVEEEGAVEMGQVAGA